MDLFRSDDCRRVYGCFDKEAPPAMGEPLDDWEDNLVAEFFQTDTPVDGVPETEEADDDKSGYLIKTTDESLKWDMSVRRFYMFVNKWRAKNYETSKMLESDLQEAISSSAIITK